MAQIAETGRASLQALLDTLDATEASPSEARNRRRQMRRIFRVPCTVWCFPSSGPMQRLTAATRNISFKGISILIEAELIGGQAIELAITLPDEETTYLAGVVAFCRAVADTHYEVGVRLRACGCQPVFSAGPAAAMPHHPWLADALPPIMA